MGYQKNTNGRVKLAMPRAMTVGLLDMSSTKDWEKHETSNAIAIVNYLRAISR